MFMKHLLILVLSLCLFCGLTASKPPCQGKLGWKNFLKDFTRNEKQTIKTILKRKLKCKINYTSSTLHRVGLSQFCEVELKCRADNLPGPINLVKCEKSKSLNCSRVKPFMYSISFNKIDQNKTISYPVKVPITCHCWKLMKNRTGQSTQDRLS